MIHVNDVYAHVDYIFVCFNLFMFRCLRRSI